MAPYRKHTALYGIYLDYDPVRRQDAGVTPLLAAGPSPVRRCLIRYLAGHGPGAVPESPARYLLSHHHRGCHDCTDSNAIESKMD